GRGADVFLAAGPMLDRLLRVAALRGRDVLALDIDQDAHAVAAWHAPEVARLAAFQDAELQRFQPAAAGVVAVDAVVQQPAIARQVHPGWEALVAPFEF